VAGPGNDINKLDQRINELIRSKIKQYLTFFFQTMKYNIKYHVDELGWDEEQNRWNTHIPLAATAPYDRYRS
jgi:predicted RNA-binding protein Jag